MRTHERHGRRRSGLLSFPLVVGFLLLLSGCTKPEALHVPAFGVRTAVDQVRAALIDLRWFQDFDAVPPVAALPLPQADEDVTVRIGIQAQSQSAASETPGAPSLVILDAVFRRTRLPASPEALAGSFQYDLLRSSLRIYPTTEPWAAKLASSLKQIEFHELRQPGVVRVTKEGVVPQDVEFLVAELEAAMWRLAYAPPPLIDRVAGKPNAWQSQARWQSVGETQVSSSQETRWRRRATGMLTFDRTLQQRAPLPSDADAPSPVRPRLATSGEGHGWLQLDDQDTVVAFRERLTATVRVRQPTTGTDHVRKLDIRTEIRR